jgi:hypothetical protein
MFGDIIGVIMHCSALMTSMLDLFRVGLIADFERGVNFHEFSQSISNCFSYIAESLRRRNVAFVKDAS